MQQKKDSAKNRQIKSRVERLGEDRRDGEGEGEGASGDKEIR